MIAWLGTTSTQDPRRVGGKAAHLSRLAASLPVPPGFCFFPSGQRLTRRQRRSLTQGYDRLTQACGRETTLSVAVRSSAVGEDGAQASFAGQHESYLNVQGAEQVAEAVEHCIDSVYTARAQAYRQSHGLCEEIAPVVLVQQFIPADVSCVVFSADPRNGQRDRVLVNAAWGLGESLVGGLVTPDLYVIAKSNLEMLESEIAEKQVMTITCANGTCEVPVPRALRCEPCLTREQLVELAQLANLLEKRQGWAVDLECAFANGKLALLQCRPITTLG
jgi:pyruvate,water dikinase